VMRLLLGMMVMLSALKPGISWLPMTAISLPRRCTPLQTSQIHRGVIGGLQIGTHRLKSTGSIMPGTMRMMGDAGKDTARNFRVLVADKVAPYVLDELR